MKAVILAGGLGSRIAEESTFRPKPMIEVGGKPILWHIMKIYSSFGINNFVVCLGYKGYLIKEYFANYFLHTSDVTFDMQDNQVEVHRKSAEPWRVTLIDTGDETQTGGRLKRAQPFLGDEAFCFTYGDGVADINISRLIDFHRSSGRLATVTAVHPPGRFGALDIEGSRITRFEEKPAGDGARINGGFFVLEPGIFDFIPNDATVWEREPLEGLAAGGQLSAYIHDGFWQPMDTLRDKLKLDQIWASGNVPWRLWI